MNRLIALAEALEALGEENSAALARVLSLPDFAYKAQTWPVKFFKDNPEFLNRAEQFASANGIDISTYLNQLTALSEPIGRQKINDDLGYKGMGSLWSPDKKVEQKVQQKKEQEPKKVQTPKFEPMKELQWEFPPPNVLKDKESFIASALAWAMGEGSGLYGQMYGSPDEIHDLGRKGEIQASRAYLRYLMKDVAPKLAATLQAKWKTASETGDIEEQQTIKSWWSSLSDVWKLLQRMISIINSYESY